MVDENKPANSPEEQTPEPVEESTTVAPTLDMLVNELEEEVSENGRTVRRQGIYLLPNLFTTGALFAGFYAVIDAVRGNFEAAADWNTN